MWENTNEHKATDNYILINKHVHPRDVRNLTSADIVLLLHEKSTTHCNSKKNNKASIGRPCTYAILIVVKIKHNSSDQ